VWGALQSRGVTGGGEGVVEATRRVPAGSRTVSGVQAQDPACFARKIQGAISADVYRIYRWFGVRKVRGDGKLRVVLDRACHSMRNARYWNVGPRALGGRTSRASGWLSSRSTHETPRDLATGSVENGRRTCAGNPSAQSGFPRTRGHVVNAKRGAVWDSRGRAQGQAEEQHRFQPLAFGAE